MSKEQKFTFEEVFQQNKNRIHYYVHRLGIHDPHNEYYTEGLHAMWLAYKKYEPNKGPMSTYFNYTIRQRLIDKIRRDEIKELREEQAAEAEEVMKSDGNWNPQQEVPIIKPEGIDLKDWTFWKNVKSILTDKQWKWVDYFIIQGYSQLEIAEKENTTVEAVKQWRKGAIKKLRSVWDEENEIFLLINKEEKE
ncbi:sigma-70 family RNA polymerase sigma factor [Ornithinibacillus halophilus]|uniref:RNA polymerase sigma factor, sigma-70 family n=1 Tax=Ornithinibacillus halophilus TaxID=930117 RepID=A0A1M5GJC9_9BACI|nr:sigma-70 family RNA polymerase sigma factor [Ornithinibacillus halophilus]SHG03855.1 RNA polymerase sigma factor, sigma-70 family [Ornithinibacillus halophilus]